MRKIVVFILTICLIINATGCGKSNYDQEISEINERLDSLESLNAHSTESPDITLEPVPTTETDDASESETPIPTQQTESVPAYDEFFKDSTVETRLGKRWNYYCYGFNVRWEGTFSDLLVSASEDWKEIEMGNRLVLELKNEWINAICVVEPDASITSEEDCLQKVQEITASFQSEGLSENSMYYLLPSSLYQFFEKNASVPEGITGGKVNLDDTWWISKPDGAGYLSGSSYYHEKSTHTDENDVEFSLLEYGAYFYLPDTLMGGFRLTVNVTFYDFDAYYNSLTSDTDKKKAKEERDYLSLCPDCCGVFIDCGLKSLLFPGAKVISQ